MLLLPLSNYAVHDRAKAPQNNLQYMVKTDKATKAG